MNGCPLLTEKVEGTTRQGMQAASGDWEQPSADSWRGMVPSIPQLQGPEFYNNLHELGSPFFPRASSQEFNLTNTLISAFSP